MSDKPIITQASAASLALTYHLYMTRVDARETKYRGEQLLKLQAETGVELVAPWKLQQAVGRASRTLDQITAALATIDNSRPPIVALDG